MRDDLVLAISKARKTEPASSQTPTIDITMEHTESASRKDQRHLRTEVSTVLCFVFAHCYTKMIQVAKREQYRCAITKAVDRARVEELEKEECFDEIPEGAQLIMRAAHVIPFLLNNFNDKIINSPHIVRDVICFLLSTHL